MENETSQNEKGFAAGFLKFLPVIQWLVMIVIAVCVFILSQRDMQTVQAQEVRDNTRKLQSLELYVDKRKEERDRQFEQLRGAVLTKEVFEAYHRADAERMARMEKMIEQMLSNQSSR